MAKPKGFDGNKRWGNSAVVGHGVNSPAMMEARSKAKALKKRTKKDPLEGIPLSKPTFKPYKKPEDR